jgi:hypothetical protein
MKINFDITAPRPTRSFAISLWILVFLVVVVLAFAVFETICTFTGGIKPDFAVAIGELLLVVVIAVGEIFAFNELRYIVRDGQFHSWLKAQELWTEKKFSEQRGRVFGRPNFSSTPWTAQETEDALEVCRRMDEFAHLIKFLGDYHATSIWDNPIGRAWLALEGTVYEERMRCAWPQKWETFEEIGRNAVAKLRNEH